MNRIKVINEPSDLVPILRAVDTLVKKEVFKELTHNWLTAKDIEERYGDEGLEALRLFEKMRLVETKWQTGDGGPVKAYHSFYTSLHISASSPVYEISDVLQVAMMPDKEYRTLEERIYDAVGKQGKFAGDLAEELDMSQVMLKSVIKRSSRLDFRGHRVERFED
ncbi:MAG: ArsR family transcriptional regulator [Thermoplasmata archaeon]